MAPHGGPGADRFRQLGWESENGSQYRDEVHHRRRRSLLVGAVVAAALTATGCGGAAPGTGGRPLVVATTTQLADFARVLGGDDVEVYGLLRPNVDAHDFEPSPADLDALARADVIGVNGLGLEPWLDDAVRAVDAPARVTVTSTRVETIDTDGQPNPHIWFDPTNASVMVANLADAMADALPDHAPEIRRRAQAYQRELAELDHWIQTRIATLERPKLVTDHDAFGYYVARYGLTFVGSVIPGFDSTAEVSAGDLNRLVERVRAEGVRAVFTERSLPARAARVLARRAGVEVVTGDDGLYGDSLGPADSDGATYLAMMRHNTNSIVEHLS